MDNWQALAPSMGGCGEQPGSVAVSTRAEERARTLSLIDFLADYDARRNPPVCDIKRYDLFLLRDADLPEVPGIGLSPAAEAWLTVDFLDLPPRPEIPEELVALLGESAAVSPHVRPEVRAAPDGIERTSLAQAPARIRCPPSRRARPDPLPGGGCPLRPPEWADLVEWHREHFVHANPTLAGVRAPHHVQREAGRVGQQGLGLGVRLVAVRHDRVGQADVEGVLAAGGHKCPDGFRRSLPPRPAAYTAWRGQRAHAGCRSPPSPRTTRCRSSSRSGAGPAVAATTSPTARRRGLTTSFSLYLTQVGLGELDELGSLAGQDGARRVEGEPLDLPVGQLGRQGEFLPGRCGRPPGPGRRARTPRAARPRDRRLAPPAGRTARQPGPCPRSPGCRDPCRNSGRPTPSSPVRRTSAPLLNTTTFTASFRWRSVRSSPSSMASPPSPARAMTWRAG